MKYCEPFPSHYEICIENKSKSDSIVRSKLTKFTNTSWKLYSKRLSNISELDFRIGKDEFNRTNSKIIDKIISLANPTKVSLSVTSDKSLHYTFRFNNISLFIETYLHNNQPHNTYIELFDEDETIFSGTQPIELGLELIEDKFPSKNGFSSSVDYSYSKYDISNVNDVDCGDDC